MFEDGPPPLPVVTHSSPSHHEFSPDGGLADLADDNRLTAVADDDLDGTSHGTALAQPNSSIPDFEPECCFILPSPILVPKLDVDTNHVENQTGHVSAPSSGVETEKSSSKQEEGNTRQLSPESSQNRSKSDRKPSGNGESSHDCPVEMTSDEKICNDETQRNLIVDSTRDISENNSEPLGERKRPTRNANEISEEIRNHDQNDCFNSNGEEFHQEDANGKPEASMLNKFRTSSFECSGKADNLHDSDSTDQTESRESTKTEFKACAVDGDHMPSAQCVEACNFSETVTDTEQVTMHSADENDKKDPESSECVQIQQTPSLNNASKVEHIKSSIIVESKELSDQLPENSASEVEICEDKREDNRPDVTDKNCNVADKNDEDEDDDFGDFEEFGDFAATQQPVQESTVIDQGKEGFTSDGWAAFESAPSGSVVESKTDESDEWAADFSSAPYAPPSMQSASKQPQINENFGEYDEASLPSLCNIYKADRVKEWVVDNVQWQDEKGNEIEEDATSENDCCKNEFENVLEDLQETRHAVDSLKAWQSLWLAIGVVEEALALKMQWSHSSFYSSFLDSLNLDANLATLRNSALPAFAQQLGESAILQPMTSAVDNKSERLASSQTKTSLCNSPSETKSKTSVEHRPETNAASDSAAASLQLNAPPKRSSNGTTVDLNSQRPQKHELAQQKRSGRHVNHSPRPEIVPEVVDSLAVPPAQFDWGNSGLTNPLTAGSISASSALMDLDFLTANESRIVTIAGRSSTTVDISYALQKDLAALGLNPSTADKHSKQPSESNGIQNCETKTTNILEELMRKGSRGEQKYTRPSELSLDARALHDRLPDLDYMLANVLLFPMGNR